MNIFDIIGPVMIGPSSSHTAGASRAGLIARILLGATPVKAHIVLYGSFAKTYQGHGADRAIVGGILGYKADDLRLKHSFIYAKKEGLEFDITTSDQDVGHPNATRIILSSANGEEVNVLIYSIGGGIINVAEINGGAVSFNAEYDTTVIFNEDKAGVISHISTVFADRDINIAFMKVFRKQEKKDAIMVIETDQKVDSKTLSLLQEVPYVKKVITMPPISVC